MDTQWPRYQVFIQERPGEPFQDAGSVHAPDPELALFNARDVFVRRPACSGLWVAPVKALFCCTAQELADRLPGDPDQGDAGPVGLTQEPYTVFCKLKPAGTHLQVGEVLAGSPEQALRRAVGAFSEPENPLSWWVLPNRQVLASDPQEAGSLFEPALHKPFRLSTDFRTVSAMRSIRSAQGPAEVAGSAPPQETGDG